MSYEDLLATALLGTERRTPGEPPAVGPEAAVPPREERSLEESILARASAYVVARRAGVVVPEPPPPDAAAPRQPIAPPDPRPRCPEGATSFLMRIVLNREPLELAFEWLERINASGMRPPHHLIPFLLDLAAARPSLGHAALTAAGPRGAWLAAHNPAWRVAGAQAVEDVELIWSEGAREERRDLLERLRRIDPARARELLAGTWDDEEPAFKPRLLAVLETNLGEDDEQFLDGTAFRDRRKATRLAAAQLLADIPTSALCRRMAERLRALGDLAKLQLDAPATCDAGMLEDGIDPKPPRGVGERAHWLAQLVRKAPLSAWGNDPRRFMKRAAKGFEWQEVVLPALAERIKVENDPRWVRAHLEHSPRTDPVLFEHLPQPEAEKIARSLDDIPAAAHCPGPWSEQLSRRVLDELSKALGDWYRKGERWPQLQAVALALHPALADEAEELREIPGAAWSIGAFCDLVSLRAAMLRELP